MIRDNLPRFSKDVHHRFGTNAQEMFTSKIMRPYQSDGCMRVDFTPMMKKTLFWEVRDLQYGRFIKNVSVPKHATMMKNCRDCPILHRVGSHEVPPASYANTHRCECDSGSLYAVQIRKIGR